MAQGIEVDFKGEYLWVPIPFAKPGQGSVVFEAQAFDNIFVGFSENPLKQHNVSDRMYECVIGMWDNTTFSIHRKNLGDEVYGFKFSDKPEMTPDPSDFKKYWINIVNGKISGGVGDLGQNKLWEWQDPYPAPAVKYVGFSNWLSKITFRNIKVGYPFVEGAGFKPAVQTATPVAAAQPAPSAVDTSVASAPADTSAAPSVDTSAAAQVDTSVAAPADTSTADTSVAASVDTSATADTSATPDTSAAASVDTSAVDTSAVAPADTSTVPAA